MNIQSKIIKALLVAVLLLAGIMAYAASTGQLITAPQNFLGMIAMPFQKMSSNLSNKIDALTDRSINIDSIIDENRQLKKELADLRLKQITYDRMALENKEYKELLSIDDDISQYETVSAAVIGRDGLDKFYSFTIDRGEKDGIAVDDVVISSDGVVGVVIETGYNFAKVSTILSPNVNVGCIAGGVRDVGILSGSYDLTDKNTCVLNHLPKDTQVQKGDIVSTTGYGTVFPKDLIIGTVEDVQIDASGNSKYATVKPAAEITNVKIVFVITDFS